MSGLIIEGVTGAGKTSIIAELARITRFDRIGEETTFDDFMGDLERDPRSARRRANQRMEAVLDDAAPIVSQRNVLLERFHFSHVALDNDWNHYDEIDRRCAALGFRVVLLTIPPEHLPARSLYRTEYAGRDWQGFVTRYGSEASALQALESSQRRRIEALQKSRLFHLRIETRNPEWNAYAKQVAAWIGWMP